MVAERSSDGAGSRVCAEGVGPGRARIAELQRARLVAAMFDVVAERGVGDVSVAHVVERSGVSRRTFYEAFRCWEDCFLAAFEHALVLASARARPAFERPRVWREQVRAGLVALLSFLDEERTIGRLLIVESSSADPRTVERREQVVAALASTVDRGREQSRNAAGLPLLTAEGLVGGVLSVIHKRMVQDGPERLLDLTNPLMVMLLTPYVGGAAARRELDRSVERDIGDTQNERLLVDPFKHSGMRLTYRTVMMLLAVAEHPNASNRLLGEAAGIKDQGQISKLLGRLRRLGLIDNTGLGPGQGAPNAWTLTETGHRMTSGIRTHVGASTHGESFDGEGRTQ